MNDPISRQAAIDVLRTCYDTETISMDNGDEYINYGDAVGGIEQLPPAEPDLIAKIQNGINVTNANDSYSCGMRNGMRWCMSLVDDKEPLFENCPSAQSEQRHGRTFQEIVVDYPSVSAHPEHEGKPYFLIKYTEDGQDFIGYGTYKPEVLSEYLIKYFMPSVQPERKKGEWI